VNHIKEERVSEHVPQVWVVRAGRGAAHASTFLQERVVAIGFGGGESVAGLKWADVTARMKKAMPDEPPVTQGLAAGALFRFANDMHESDIVITPEPGGTLLVGGVTGGYEFTDTPPAEDYRHMRRVTWFARIQRSSLPKEIRASLGSIMTFFTPNYQEELRATLEPLRSQAPPATLAASPSPEATAVIVQTSVAVPAITPDPPIGMGSEFETDKRKLLYLLEQIANRDLALPDFQRSFVWDPNATRELIVSIIRGFPAGNLLLLKGGSDIFIPRAVEDAPELNGHKPGALILDGQQRLSSLYQAVSGVGTHRFFIDIAALMNGEDIDSAVKTISRGRGHALLGADQQARALLFPLSRVRDYADWRDEVLDARERAGEEPETRKRLRSYLNRVEKAVIAPIREYQFPLTTLAHDTSTEAVCTIFETLNRTGIKLSVFELITARAFNSGERLRQRWKDALDQYPILEDFGIDPYYILQAIALRLGKKPQRGVVATLGVGEIVNEWDTSIHGMAEGLEMLRDECGVLTAKWLPYAPMLPTMAAVWHDVTTSSGAHVGASRFKLQQWFWCASFVGDYDSAPNSRAEADVPLLRTWLGGGDAPPVVRGFQFDSATWLSVTVRQRGLYRSTMALLAKRRPLDFHKAVPLTKTLIESTAVDDHHVFPAAYLKDEGVTGYVDTVLNHTLIDKQTNVRIGKKAPSVYITEMRDELGSKMDEVLRSHGLPPELDGPLLNNDYDSFLDWRRIYLEDQLRQVTT